MGSCQGRMRADDGGPGVPSGLMRGLRRGLHNFNGLAFGSLFECSGFHKEIVQWGDFGLCRRDVSSVCTMIDCIVICHVRSHFVLWMDAENKQMVYRAAP